MARRYSTDLKNFIKDNVKGTTTKELLMLVNAKFGADFTELKMQAYKKNNKLKSGTPLGLPAGRPTDKYPEEIRKFVADRNRLFTFPDEGVLREPRNERDRWLGAYSI